MKKFTKLCLVSIIGFVALATQVSAQITITSADLPTAGALVITATDTTSGYLPGNPSASSQTWNFGALNHQKTAKVSFMAPSATKYSSVFPSANLADSTFGNVGHYFFTNNSAEFAVEGVEEFVTDATYGVSFQVLINLNPVFVQSTLPATLNTKDNGVSKGSYEFAPAFPVSLAYDSIKVSTQITYFDTVDAYGTMTTPTGTYAVLRQNHHEVDIDSANGRSSSGKWSVIQATSTTTHQYNWYANGVGYILAQMNVNPSTGTVTNVVWDSTAPAGINELSYNGKVTVFPNPCTSQITFTTVGNIAQYINVYDVAGRKLEQVEMKSGLVNINTSSYASGMYLYTLNDKDGNIVDRGKFMVK